MVALTEHVQTSLPRPIDPFSLVPYIDDLWHVAKSRTCFQDDESKVQVDWTDSDSEHRGLFITFSTTTYWLTLHEQ